MKYEDYIYEALNQYYIHIVIKVDKEPELNQILSTKEPINWKAPV